MSCCSPLPRLALPLARGLLPLLAALAVGCDTLGGDAVVDGGTPAASFMPVDGDGDGVLDKVDNCPAVANADQANADRDSAGDLCDNCPSDQNDLQTDADADGVGDDCPCDACEEGAWCQADAAGAERCVADCVEARQCGGDTCCPLGTACSEDGACLVPDLELDREKLIDSMKLSTSTFEADDCAIVEGCVAAPGERRLLRFATRTGNIGDGDLYMGKPEENPELFTYSDCHRHHHFEGYATYELLDATGTVVLTGHKQAFCLMDYERYGEDAGRARYNCNKQGISVDWADTYDAYLDCQWVDVTDVPAGDYQLRVSVNPLHIFPELSYENNVSTVPVTLSDAPAESP
jgi:hypothetical protein